MKALIQKISLLTTLVLISAFSMNAQTISVSATLAGQTQVIASGTTFDATAGGIVTSLNTFLPGTLTITNTGSSALVLTLNGSSYLTLTGTAPSDFTITPTTAFGGTIAAGASQTFNVALGSGATNGLNKTLTITIKSNDATTPTYAGSVKYSFSGITTTGITKASDIGLTVYPNPSATGTFYFKSSNVNVNKIVVTNSSGVSEEYYSTTSFTTNLKGLLLVQLYTDNGLVYDKLLVQ